MAEGAPFKGLTCLLVDDEYFNIVAMKRLLKSWGCHVVVARDGADALLKLKSGGRAFAVVLMDMMMPGQDGYTAIRKIRQDPEFADLCVIALTAQAMEGDRENCLDSGASDYLCKPVDDEKLKAMLIRHLGWND